MAKSRLSTVTLVPGIPGIPGIPVPRVLSRLCRKSTYRCTFGVSLLLLVQSRRKPAKAGSFLAKAGFTFGQKPASFLAKSSLKHHAFLAKSRLPFWPKPALFWPKPAPFWPGKSRLLAKYGPTGLYNSITRPVGPLACIITSKARRAVGPTISVIPGIPVYSRYSRVFSVFPCIPGIPVYSCTRRAPRGR